MGRKESVWGQMGVRRMAGKSGWTREPPAEREYAVDPVEQISGAAHKRLGPINQWNLPVGVEKMQPSAWTTVKSSLSP
jgi:hypothetical protein